LTTEDCLLNENRNSHLGKEKIEKKLENFLGAKKILWLNKGIIGDDTDSHVDQLARFANRNTILVAYEQNEKDGNYENLKENYERLQKFTDLDGKSFEVVAVPMPDTLIFHNGRLPASYLNFYICNYCVLLPIFGCSQDKNAIKIFEKVFPTYKIVPLDARDIVIGQGSFHCLTQQVPS